MKSEIYNSTRYTPHINHTHNCKECDIAKEHDVQLCMIAKCCKSDREDGLSVIFKVEV